jgi:hypothetical protein
MRYFHSLIRAVAVASAALEALRADTPDQGNGKTARSGLLKTFDSLHASS